MGSITVFTAATILGLTTIVAMYLLSMVIRNKQMPRGLVILQGLFTVLGLGLLIFYSAGHEAAPWVSFLVILLAALAGLVLFYQDVTGKAVPKWLAILQTLTAIVGYTILLVFTFS